MRTTSLLECQGTVVVHRDQSVSCTDDTCPRDLPRGTWFSLHSSFVRCSTALGGTGCLDCDFDLPRTVGHGDENPTSSIAARRRGRLLDSARSRHPSSCRSRHLFS